MGFIPMIDLTDDQDEDIRIASSPVNVSHLIPPLQRINLNEISVINNSTNPDTSMNVTQNEILRKLNEQKKTSKEFDNQSNASYFFNEEDLSNYEEHVQLKVNEIWTNTQTKID